MIIALTLGIAVAGTVYFALSWIAVRREMSGLTALELRNAQIAEDLSRERQGSAWQRVLSQAKAAGTDGEWVQFAGTMLIGYLLAALAISMAGIPQLAALGIALPLSAVAGAALFTLRRRRDKAKFEAQLLQFVRLVAGQLENGDTPQMAFHKAALQVDDPLRGLMERALASRVATESLASVIAPIAEQYPGQALTFLVTALEIDDRLSTRLGPALRQAQHSLERKKELSSEALAEISQARAEFLGITIVIAAICVAMVYVSRDVASGAYSSPLAIIVLTVTGGNYALGIVRAMRIFRKAADGS